MSQVGPKERCAKDKTESKQLKSVKNFIARTQAEMDAKLTQSRLLPTLSPAKRENDPFHPSLDLSPSREKGTSSNVISDDEQQENVAKELFPLAETTAQTAKGKGAQEPQHQVQAPAPPTSSEKVQDSVPEGRHENTEGSHPRDAEELKQQEECREDPCRDSAMNNDATLNDNARRTNEVEPDNSLLTPREEQSTPSAIPSPEGTHEKAEDWEDPIPDEADGNSGKPFFNPSLAPDGVFAKISVKHKGEINTHDQQALWGETHAHDTLRIDTNELVLEKHHKQIIYDQVHPTIDLCASDGCTFSMTLIAPATMPTPQSDMTILGTSKTSFITTQYSTFFHAHKITTTPNKNTATRGPSGRMRSKEPCKKPLIPVLCTKVPSFSREWKTTFRRRPST